MIRSFLNRTKLYAFNLVNRDQWVAEQAAALPDGTLVLDVGAGSCPYRSLFDHCDYRTQDFQQLLGDQLRYGAYGDIDYICDATAIPVDDKTFDVILCTEVMEHIAEPIELIREFSRLLKPGGCLLLTAPLGSGIHQEPHHYYGGFTPFWYERFLREYGFTEISIEPNAGSYSFYSQESLCFLKTTIPWRLPAHIAGKCFWFPFWLLLLPVLGGLIPVAAALLDRYDKDKRFTVGYHVKARKPAE